MVSACARLQSEVCNMIAWLSENIGTIVVLLAVACIVGAIFASMVRGRKAGKSCTCGGSCGSCPMGGSCHSGKNA